MAYLKIESVFLLSAYAMIMNCHVKLFLLLPHIFHSTAQQPHWVPASSVFEPIPHHLYQAYWQQYFFKKSKLNQEETIALLQQLPSGTSVTQNDPCALHMQPTAKMQQRFADTPLNGSREDAGEQHRLKCHANGYAGHKDVYGRILIHQPSNTITTGCHNPSKGRFVHPWKHHGITLRHAGLQSFPESFHFFGTSTQQAKSTAMQFRRF